MLNQNQLIGNTLMVCSTLGSIRMEKKMVKVCSFYLIQVYLTAHGKMTEDSMVPTASLMARVLKEVGNMIIWKMDVIFGLIVIVTQDSGKTGKGPCSF